MSRFLRIHQILSEHLSPTVLIIEDESDQHQRRGVETHFKVVIAAEKFKEITRIDRHRMINDLLADELESGLHALGLHLYTPEEWAKKMSMPMSPSCNHQRISHHDK